jgi:hypothetical protein
MSRPKGFKHTEETKAKMRANHPHLHRPHTEEEKKKLADTWRRIGHPKGLLGKHHTDETKRKGKRNANWKGGLTELVKGIRRSPEFYQWRKSVLERDHRTCRDCGSTENINAHHIKSLIEYPEFVFEIDNGLTLCEDCHKRHTSWQRLNGRR